MTVKLFVLGLPGSGKSTVAREIEDYIGKKGVRLRRINDYIILEQMFHDDAKCEQFRPAENGGFDILDLTVFDTALKMLEKVTKQYILPAIPEGMILIEFARNDYRKAFQQFSNEFLQDSYFLYLDTWLEICKQRIRNRITNPNNPDDYNVSEYIFEAYYNKDNGKDLYDILEGGYQIDKQLVKIIDNNSSLGVVLQKIAPFIDAIIASELARRGTSAHPMKQFARIQ